MPPPGWTHQIQVLRFQITVSSEGQPSESLVAQGNPFFGYLHSASSQEDAVAATLGTETTGHCLIPYGTDVLEQDRLQVTYADGSTQVHRVQAVRDNHICLRADIERDVA